MGPLFSGNVVSLAHSILPGTEQLFNKHKFNEWKRIILYHERISRERGSLTWSMAAFPLPESSTIVNKNGCVSQGSSPDQRPLKFFQDIDDYLLPICRSSLRELFIIDIWFQNYAP